MLKKKKKKKKLELRNFTLANKTWHPLYRMLGGPQDHSEWVQNISPPPGFKFQTI